MTYTAMLYLVFERQDRRLGHRIISKKSITAKTFNDAKARGTRLVKNDERMSKWQAQGSTARWSPVIEENGKRFVQKPFRNPLSGSAPSHFAAIAEIIL